MTGRVEFGGGTLWLWTSRRSRPEWQSENERSWRRERAGEWGTGAEEGRADQSTGRAAGRGRVGPGTRKQMRSLRRRRRLPLSLSMFISATAPLCCRRRRSCEEKDVAGKTKRRRQRGRAVPGTAGQARRESGAQRVTCSSRKAGERPRLDRCSGSAKAKRDHRMRHAREEAIECARTQCGGDGAGTQEASGRPGQVEPVERGGARTEPRTKKTKLER